MNYHLVDHTNIMLVSHVNLIGQRYLLGNKYKCIFLYITSFNYYNMKTQRVIYTHFSSKIAHPHVLWNFHDQHWVKCTQQPFRRLGKLRVNSWVLWFPLMVICMDKDATCLQRWLHYPIKWYVYHSTPSWVMHLETNNYLFNEK